MSQALAIVYRCIANHLIKKAGLTHKTAKTGGITLIQRFGGTARRRSAPAIGTGELRDFDLHFVARTSSKPATRSCSRSPAALRARGRAVARSGRHWSASKTKPTEDRVEISARRRRRAAAQRRTAGADPRWTPAAPRRRRRSSGRPATASSPGPSGCSGGRRRRAQRCRRRRPRSARERHSRLHQLDGRGRLGTPPRRP